MCLLTTTFAPRLAKLLQQRGTAVAPTDQKTKMFNVALAHI